MNRTQGARVQGRARGLWPGVLVLGLLAMQGCVEIGGGAAELSWSLRSFEGKPIAECRHARIERVRLIWESVPEAGEEPVIGAVDFECETRRGITDFVIGEGRQLLRIEPLCADGESAAPHTYEVPPPLLRRVVAGQVVTLDSLLVVADDSRAGCAKSAGCTCLPPPTQAGP